MSRDHITSHFHLNYFTNENKEVFYYSRKTGRYNFKSPAGVAWVNDWNSFENSTGGKNNDAEEILAELETRVGEVFKKISLGDFNLTFEEKLLLAEFVSKQAYRGVGIRSRIEATYTEVLSLADRILKNNAPERFSDTSGEVTFEGRKIKFLKENGIPIVPKEELIRPIVVANVSEMVALKWTFMLSENTNFIISDHPLVMHFIEGNYLTRPAGLMVPNTETTIPITSKCCLLIEPRIGDIGHCVAPQEYIHTVNLRTALYADEYLYGTKKEDIAFLVKMLYGQEIS